MNGIHDMGGLHGFGAVEVERDEPVFHHRWERRVFGMITSLSMGNIDAGRHGFERLDPVTYLKNGYYGRWLAGLEQGLIEAGVLVPGDVEARMKKRTRRRSATRSRSSWPPPSVAYTRPIDAWPAFSVDQAVVTRDHQPAGHTRLPAYARRRRGIVVRVHPAMVFPDDHAHGRGENPQYLYTVRFAGAELWGPDAEPGTIVNLDLFEPYLDEL